MARINWYRIGYRTGKAGSQRHPRSWKTRMAAIAYEHGYRNGVEDREKVNNGYS